MCHRLGQDLAAKAPSLEVGRVQELARTLVALSINESSGAPVALQLWSVPSVYSPEPRCNARMWFSYAWLTTSWPIWYMLLTSLTKL